MKVGKLPNSKLEKLILNDLVARREETVLRPAVGEDCCALKLGDNLCVISTDPITAADENAGILAVLVSLNDLAACGAEPVGILSTVLLPIDITEEKIEKLFKTVNEICFKMDIDVLGGHTEVTDSVNKIIIITTAIGKVPSNGLIRSDGAKPGDAILMTKAAGLEGTAIISTDKINEINKILNEIEIEKAKLFINEISVLTEGLLAAKNGAHAMHDVTEGGILGAIWEVCSASGYGAEINIESIKIREITNKICDFYNISPLKLISSGSMLITCSQKDKDGIINEICKAGIDCTEIGLITEKNKVIAVYSKEKREVEQPGADELYKVI
ncbi:MAG: AIR synthase family protein [Clostridiales bacterium]|nr:AIR synthase family protein [Clostridiales bacterium]